LQFFTFIETRRETMPDSILGIHEEIDQFVSDLTVFCRHVALRGSIPANAGDVSFLLSREAEETVLQRFDYTKTLHPFSSFSDMVEIRADGRDYFNAESFPAEVIQDHIQSLAGRLLVISATGSKLWDVERDAGKRLCIIQVSPNCDGIYVVYGNREHGTIPSIETASHLVANAVNLRAGLSTSASLHCHPSNLVSVGMHVAVDNSHEQLNRTLYTQREGILTNVADLVGIVPYEPSGSRALLEESIEKIYNHRFVLWSYHGVLIRGFSFERCIDMLEYAEDAAALAVRSLTNPGSFGLLSKSDLEKAVELYGLSPAILEILDNLP